MTLKPAAQTTRVNGAFTEITKTRLTTTAASVTFDGLTQRVFHLSAYVIPTSTLVIRMTFNGDSSSIYDRGSNRTIGGTWTASFTLNGAYLDITDTTGSTGARIIEAWVGKISATLPASMIFRSGLASISTSHSWGTGRWDNTSDTITSIEIVASTSTFAADTVLHLEGRA